MSKDDCFDECFVVTDCILAFVDLDGTCFLLDYAISKPLTVVETTRADGYYVAFKTSMSSVSCPASPDLINLTVTVAIGTYSWFRTESGWSFGKCVDDWKRFDRNDSVIVCLQVFNMTLGSSLDAARQLCADKGYVLSAMGSVEESKYFLSILLKIFPGYDHWYYSYWIDGKRNCSETDSKCNNFVWTDGYTTGNGVLENSNCDFSFTNGGKVENCLVVSKNYNDTQALNDVSCDSGVFPSAFGAICGYRLN